MKTQTTANKTMSRMPGFSALVLAIVLTAAAVGFMAVRATAQDLAADEVLIEVREIIINESEILSEAEIRSIVDSIIGKPVTLAQLQAAVDQINRLYDEKQFITARAILPPQTVEDGTVRIQLVEGRVGDITLENNRATKDEYFLKRISLQPGDLVRLDVLERDLLYFNATNDVQVRAEIKAGKEFGLTDVTLWAVEPPRNQVVAFADNGGREETGLYRLGVSAGNNSLFGSRDTLSLGVTYAEGTLGFSAAYEVPMVRRGSRLGASYDYTKAEIISGIFEPVDIDGRSTNLGVKFTHPLLIRNQGKLSGGLQWQSKATDNYFFGARLQTTKLQTVTLGMTGQWMGKGQSLSARQDVVWGRVQFPKEDDFIKYFGTIAWQRLLPINGLLTVEGQWQLANRELLPFAEQFSLGGMSAARGYPAGTLIGDQGFSLSAEVEYPIGKRVRGKAFLDYGGVFPYKGNEEPITVEDYLASGGLGVVAKLTERIFANVVVGWPIGAVSGDPQLHFFIQAKLW